MNIEVIDEDYVEPPRPDYISTISHPSREPCPLELYIRLYRKAPNALYIGHFEGFKYLRHWLGEAVVSSPTYRLPRLLENYEIQELAKLLNVSREAIFSEILRQEEGLV